ncbi:hypothetical protein MSG28_005661 [Choristoneura fumiferana]|uniref:Uncharacterized protein n=1 Tax=Choristoneura fumiferana TaxID=7141 RepID=A0ACC0KZP6_CHOFU|nr:hypothetical protein MSG28_005661 [Choristoneura fumiferana]
MGEAFVQQWIFWPMYKKEQYTVFIQTAGTRVIPTRHEFSAYLGNHQSRVRTDSRAFITYLNMSQGYNHLLFRAPKLWSPILTFDVLIFLLCVLFALDVLWTWLILQVLYKSIKTGQTNDFISIKIQNIEKKRETTGSRRAGSFLAQRISLTSSEEMLPRLR